MKEKRFDIIISRHLKDLGIAANTKGYYALIYGIEVLVNDMTLIGSFTKKLYPMIAQKFDITPTGAERRIRHAIERGWSRASEDAMIKMFGYSVSAEKGKPTNSEFMATIADHILVEHYVE